MDSKNGGYIPKRKGRGIRTGHQWCHGCEDWIKDSMFNKDDSGYAVSHCRICAENGMVAVSRSQLKLPIK